MADYCTMRDGRHRHGGEMKRVDMNYTNKFKISDSIHVLEERF